MGKCWLEQPEFSWLKAVLNYEFEAQIGHIWYESADVTHKIEKTPVSF